ncbi:MAG: ABC transporter substrate-binding protein [Opitutaceae bacterium]
MPGPLSSLPTARLLLTLLAASTILSSALPAEKAPTEIRFGVWGNVSMNTVGGVPTSSELTSLANYLGFFEEEFGKDGTKINEIFVPGQGPALNEALAQGDIDFASYNGLPQTFGLAGGLPAQIVLARRYSGSGNNYYIAVHNDAPIHSIKDLKGKRISVYKGTASFPPLVTLLEAHGLTDNDVTYVNIQASDAINAFNAGAIDAVFGGINLLILRDQGRLRILERTQNFKLPASASGTLVSNKFAAKYPDVVKRLIKVLIRTSWWASQEENREKLLQFIASRTINYKYVSEDYRGDLRERYNPLIDEQTVHAYKEIADFALKHKFLRRAVDEQTIRGWFAPQYQQAALRELGLTNYWLDADKNGTPASKPGANVVAVR